MSDNTALRALTEQMAREGIRRLLIISGEENWCQGQALALRDILPGDWLWVGANAPAEPNCTPQALQTLLGREFRHAVFDAGQGFDAAAFAALSGTLLAGSWLVLLTPPRHSGTRIRTWIHYAGAIVLSPFPHRTLLSTSNG